MRVPYNACWWARFFPKPRPPLYTVKYRRETQALDGCYGKGPREIEGWQDAVNAMRVDFAAVKDGRVLYVQATDEMLASEIREREIASLKSIRDNHEKIVVARQGSYDTDIDGIRIVSARDFFL